ncbi:hypothetical protein [Clostridium estertheticum]|uniref:hypothetical protein n=1 Tax=Clostridium estertheticum TaxID=238834 RepID=UPI001CF4FE84|nr:hypothetical protein [Clostridium estertheticum]MCB2362410.1 hypothetical protein [Clostridium estertheticum]
MLNELRKFTSELYIKILILVVILVSIAVSIASIRSFSEVKSVEECANYLHGKAAIHLTKERYKNSKGILTTDKLNEVLKYYKSMPSSDVAFVKTDIKYPGITSLMNEAYLYGDTKEADSFYKLNNMNDFYKKNIKLITKELNDSENTYEPWEKNIIFEKAKTIDNPFIIDFSDQWVKVYPSLTICFMLIAISAIVIGSRLFSYEKDKNMDVLLVSLGDRPLRNIGTNKIKALLTFLTIEFLVSVIIISIAIFSNTGLSAWNSQIQIQYFTSIYHLTFGKVYLLSVFTGWISIIAIGTFVAALNAFTQKSYITLVLGFLLTFIPITFNKLNMFPVIITKFFRMQPINGFFIRKNLLSLQVFKFLTFNTLTITAIIINSIIILGICILIASRLFSTRIKNT